MLVFCVRTQMAERLGNWAINQKVAGSIPGRAIDFVSLGKALQFLQSLCNYSKVTTLFDV